MRRYRGILVLAILTVALSPIFPQSATNSAYAASSSNRLGIDALDKESQRCMTCHDGSRALRIELGPAGAPMEIESFGMTRTKNHAIGMEYAVAYNAKPREFVAPPLLKTDVKLVGGKVGCLSCHAKKEIIVADGGAFDRSLLDRCTVDDREGFQEPKCLSCHIK
jgi:hypothetical protein